MLMIFAGVGLVGASDTVIPAAHNIPMMMSESLPPHLPSTRTGRICPCQVMPAMPVALLVSAPRMPAVRVPCQELDCAVAFLQSLFGELLTSALVIQSPGSEASASETVAPRQVPPLLTNVSE